MSLKTKTKNGMTYLKQMMSGIVFLIHQVVLLVHIYLKNIKKTCDRLNQQCGGNSGGGPDGNQPWDGPKYCGNSPGEKTNCNCVVVNDNYFQCKLKT